MARTFEIKPAKREAVPLIIGLVGPSGVGKSLSALRLAAGIAKVTGKKTVAVDTEARRLLWYADYPGLSFEHVEFKAPFGPLDYLAAIEHAVKSGAGQVVVDSLSHEWEGSGGILEIHESEVERLAAGGDWQKRERVKMLAWVKPKTEARRLLNSVVQLGVNLIFTFRAKEKLKIEKGKEPIPLGYQAIADDQILYEMSACLLLLPGADGVPTMKPIEVGEKAMVKVPAQFRAILDNHRGPIDEKLGEEMARWAAGTGPRIDDPPQSKATPLPDERSALLGQILAILREDFPGQTEGDKIGRATLLKRVFNSASWKRVEELPVDALRAGLAKMQPSTPREREPGEESE